MEFVDFLRARLDEDEALAKAASPGPWHPGEESDEVLAVDGITVADGFALSGRQLRATTEHIARHDPARVLAEVDAKRRMLEEYSRTGSVPDTPERRSDPSWRGDLGYLQGLSRAVRLLTLPYADHPDYRAEWQP